MKKITNNTRLGQLTMLLDLVLAICIIISVVFLLKFDRVNVQLQNVKPTYEVYVQDSLRLEQSIHDYNKKMTNAEMQIEILKAKIDSASAAYQAIEKDKKVAAKEKENMKQAIQFSKDQLQSFERSISEDSAACVLVNDTLSMNQIAAQPLVNQYNQLCQDTVSPRRAYNVLIILTIILFFGKILTFAFWSFKNMKNVHLVAPWMQKSTKPVWAIWSWFIPVYNLFKPCSIFTEIWDETKYVLKEKLNITNDNDDNQMEFIGLWWALLLIAKSIFPLVIGGAIVCLNFWLFPLACADMLDMGVFFGIKGFFLNLNHTLIAVMLLVFWLIYLAYEIYLVNSYNKLNQQLFDNQSKFEEK